MVHSLEAGGWKQDDIWPLRLVCPQGHIPWGSWYKGCIWVAWWEDWWQEPEKSHTSHSMSLCPWRWEPCALGDGNPVPRCSGKLVGLMASLTFTSFHQDIYPSYADAFSIRPQVAWWERLCCPHIRKLRLRSSDFSITPHTQYFSELGLLTPKTVILPTNGDSSPPSITGGKPPSSCIRLWPQNSQNPIVDKHLMLVGDVFPKCFWGQPASWCGRTFIHFQWNSFVEKASAVIVIGQNLFHATSFMAFAKTALCWPSFTLGNRKAHLVRHQVTSLWRRPCPCGLV